jgi:hypothetical protein
MNYVTPLQELVEVYEPYTVPDSFCEALARIERVGSCRRLVFVVTDQGGPHSMRAVVAKLVVPAEVMADLAQAIAADRPEPGTAFVRMPVDAVAH